MIRISYIFRSGRKARINDCKDHPTEFFYGFQQLRGQDIDVTLIEDSDIGMAPPLTRFARLIGKTSNFFGGLPIGIFVNFVIGGHFTKFDKDRFYIATTNGIGMALAIARALRLLRAPVILVAMGLMPSAPSILQKWLYRKFSRYVEIVCISRTEQRHLERILPENKIRYFPFGVDLKFWSPSEWSRPKEYVLAIGNDRARDWKTLVDCWTPEMPQLKIVSNLPVRHSAPNIEVISGDWRSQKISDQDIREFYRGARCVVIPLKETLQPAGQSVCLQAMSCGIPVIMSDISGIWERNLIRDGYSCKLVPPGDASALRDAITLILDGAAERGSVVKNARQLIEEHFNTNNMAMGLLSVVKCISVKDEDSARF